MSYSLDMFSSEIFGDCYNPGPETDRPTTIAQAIAYMDFTRYEDLCKEFYNGYPVDIDMIMSQIADTDTVSNITVPIEVWIDREGFFTINVY